MAPLYAHPNEIFAIHTPGIVYLRHYHYTRAAKGAWQHLLVLNLPPSAHDLHCLDSILTPSTARTTMFQVAKRARKPSAFAPAVGVKQPTNAPAATSPSPSSKSASAATPIKSALIHFLSGGIAAGLVRASLQPLDTCKTRLQASRGVGVPLRKVLFTGGVAGLYKGVVPGVAGIVPAAAVYMLTFQTLKSSLAKRFPRRKNDIVIAASAGLADVAASLVRVPCEVLKQRLQVGVYSNIMDALQTIARKSQLPRLYSGLSAQLVRDVPYAAAEFVVYENLKSQYMSRKRSDKVYGPAARQLQHRLQDQKMSKLDSLGIGAIAGAVAAIVSNPADVVKTRLMTQVKSLPRTSAQPFPPSAHYKGVADAFVRIAREEGIQTFAKGIAPRIAAKALQSALFFAAYEGLRRAVSNALKVDPNSLTPAH